MKHRILIRNNFDATNRIRTTNLNALHRRHRNSLLIHGSHYARRQRRMNNTIRAHKRSLPILCTNLHTHGPGNLLRFSLKKKSCLILRNHINSSHHSSCLSRICPSMRTNVILRGHSNHKPILSNPDNWERARTMIMRKLLRLPTNLKSIFLPTLHHPNSNRCSSDRPPHSPS